MGPRVPLRGPEDDSLLSDVILGRPKADPGTHA